MNDNHQKAKEVLNIERTIATLQDLVERIRELEFTPEDRSFYKAVKEAAAKPRR